MKCVDCPAYTTCRRMNDLRKKRRWCPRAKEQPQPTNADRIRAMSDEELAKHFLTTDICQYIASRRNGWCAAHATCEQCVLDWLRQPVKDGDNDG